MRNIILGVDGGGTKTKTVAVDASSGKEIGSVETGSIHVNTMGLQTAADNVENAVRSLRLAPHDRIVALAIGDPAIDDSADDVHTVLMQEIQARNLCPADTAYFSKSDVFMALYAFTKGQPGALLVSGTGSMGVALQERYQHRCHNKLLTVGGWGLPTNDPGSGYDIAVHGIQAAMDAFDEIIQPTQLCDEALRHFDVATSRALIDVFNGSDITRGEIASFAVCVDRCAQAGDEAAAGILTDAGHILGRYGLSMLRRIPVAHHRLGMYGSVLLRNALVQQTFVDTIRKVLPNAQVCVPQQPPEYGAVRFAADALNIQWEE